MDKNELQLYNQVIHEKYKHYRLWQVLAIVFMCLTILFSVLYFASGNIIEETINNNDVEVENNGESNNTNVTINN